MTNYFKKTSTALFFLLSITTNVAAQNFSHDDFHKVISQHVSNGVVNYPAISNSIDYRNYVTALERKNIFHSNTEKLSYWINAYNALAIKGILDGRSPESFFGKVGYFYNAEYEVNGETTNLYDLEHDIIIPLGEPRIHFALNCASASCPKLNSTTYQTDKLEQQLEQAAIDFINNKKLNQFDMETKTAHISRIFDWFEEDFTKYSGSVQNYLALYITDKDISNALADNMFEIEYLEYDWSLNGIPPDTSGINED